MPEADYDFTAMAFQNTPGAPNPDTRLRVKFFLHPVKDEVASAKEGRAIFVDKEYIEFMIPGATDNIFCRQVWEQDFQRFPMQYAQFKNKREQTVVGTPLSMWPVLTTAQVKELEYLKIFTVEQLASLPDNVSGKFMGFYSLKQQAADFLAAAKDSSYVTNLRRELEDRDNKINALMKAVEDQAERLKALEDDE